MNCQNHPEIPAAAYCRTCGKPVCEQCRRDAFGTVFCEEHAPAASYSAGSAAAPPPPPPPYVPPVSSYVPPSPPPPLNVAPSAYRGRGDISPALAFFLGLIPGVGAIYNGQYAKGLVHAVVWGLLMSIADSRASHGLEPVFVMLVIAWWAYMAIEAHRTAQKLQAGEPVDEYSSLVSVGGHQAPVAGISLVILGVLLLLHTLNLLDFEYVARYWPVLLIAAGIYLLWGRFASHDEARREMRHER